MYVLVYNKSIYVDWEDLPYYEDTKVYHCKSKKLAEAYLEKRFMELGERLSKRHDKGTIGRITESYISSNKDYGYLEYDESAESEYPFMRETFKILKCPEILDLPDGPKIGT